MSQEPYMPWWECRYTQLTDLADVRVSLAAVFRGENAENAYRLLTGWPNELLHFKRAEGAEEATLRLYIRPFVSRPQAHFMMSELFRWAWGFEWSLLRLHPGLGGPQAFCLRESEVQDAIERDVSPPKWGFGRPHPVNPDFKPNQLVAGPLVDFPPGGEPEGWDWEGFEPVWLRLGEKIGPARHEVKDLGWLRLSSEWRERSVIFRAERMAPPPEINAVGWPSPPPWERG